MCVVKHPNPSKAKTLKSRARVLQTPLYRYRECVWGISEAEKTGETPKKRTTSFLLSKCWTRNGSQMHLNPKNQCTLNKVGLLIGWCIHPQKRKRMQAFKIDTRKIGVWSIKAIAEMNRIRKQRKGVKIASRLVQRLKCPPRWVNLCPNGWPSRDVSHCYALGKIKMYGSEWMRDGVMTFRVEQMPEIYLLSK